MKKVTFKVTKEILKEAAQRIAAGRTPANNCAIVLAVREKYSDFTCGVTSGSLNNNNLEAGGILDLPDYVSEYIRRFDSMGTGERIALPELKFTLEIPEQ